MEEIKMKKIIKYITGDIFRVQLNEKTYGYGQVVLMLNDYHYGIIYDFVTEDPFDDLITNPPIAFFVSTTFSDLSQGRWVVIGNKEVPKIKFPNYKQEKLDGGFSLMDADGNLIEENPSTEQLENAIELEMFSSSAVVDAMKQKFIDGTWDHCYDHMIYKS